MTLTRLSPIDGETILPLEDAKDHLRVRHTDEDTLIASLRNAACRYVERVSGVALAEAEYRWDGPSFARVAVLPVRPVVEVNEVVYHDDAGEAVSYAGSRLVNGVVYPATGESWPTAYGYASVTFTAGDECPPDLQAAVKLMLGHLYENRSGATEKPLALNPAVDALIQTYRQVMV